MNDACMTSHQSVFIDTYFLRICARRGLEDRRGQATLTVRLAKRHAHASNHLCIQLSLASPLDATATSNPAQLARP